MSQDVILQVEEAISGSRKWAETGWSVKFGPRRVEVSSLKEAQALPKSFVYRQEAISYWNQANLTGNEAADSGEKALAALRNNDIAVAGDVLYFCQFIEKPFAESAKTWLPLYETFQQKRAEL